MLDNVRQILDQYEKRSVEEDRRWQQMEPDQFIKHRDEFLLAVGPATGRFLNILAKEAKAKTILEVGTSFGYSTIWLAEAARAIGGKVISLELQPEKQAYAREQLVHAGLDGVVDFRLGDARALIEKINEPIQLVLLDLWKDLYIPCFDLFYPKLSPGAIIVADNMLFPEGARLHAKQYRQYVRAKADIQSILLPIGSGLEVSRCTRGLDPFISADAAVDLRGEFTNFQDIAKGIVPLPGEIPALSGIEVYGGSMPLNGTVGGDHIIYVDFKKRFDLQARIRRAESQGRSDLVAQLELCKHKAGIAILDVSGHRVTDCLLAAMLHQAFLLGAIYELDMSGNITKRLFENLNTRVFNTSSLDKYVTLLYGEISEDTTFKFISAGHPLPLVFSVEEDRFMDVPDELSETFPPIGMLLSFEVIDRNATQSILPYKEGYKVNEWKLMGAGDIMLLYTDGLSEHSKNGEAYAPYYLERKVREVKTKSAREIYDAIRDDLQAFGPRQDDISFVVIKRT
jgi:predicted O-methyltransferase YrrM/serine phosphatase RsbU (regulator of sigma subunit)